MWLGAVLRFYSSSSWTDTLNHSFLYCRLNNINILTYTFSFLFLKKNSQKYQWLRSWHRSKRQQKKVQNCEVERIWARIQCQHTILGATKKKRFEGQNPAVTLQKSFLVCWSQTPWCTLNLKVLVLNCNVLLHLMLTLMLSWKLDYGQKVLSHELNPLYLSDIFGHAVQTEAQTVHRMHHGCIMYQYVSISMRLHFLL